MGMLSDLGVDFSPLNKTFEQANFPALISVREETKSGLIGSSVEVRSLEEGITRRNLQDIQKIIEGFSLASSIKERSKRAFKKLARIEAKCHGIEEKDVHFHELGAIDTIVDIVGAFWGIEQLNISRVLSSYLPWFEGQVSCEHGILPLPAPATLSLLKGKPFYPTSINEEIITPTGALLLDELVDEFVSGFQGSIKASGIGWGKRDIRGVAFNGLRGILFSPSCIWREEDVVVLETNIDHLSGEEVGNIFETLLSKGAFDVLYVPVIMKKNRPGGILKVLCPLVAKDEMVREVFNITHTLGIRMLSVTRYILERKKKKVVTEMGEVEIKEYYIEGKKYFRIEYESLKRIAREKGISIYQARQILLKSISVL